jgi:hypothetical protein
MSTSKTRSHSSPEIPRTVANCFWAMPALATATSIPPSASTISATAFISALWSVTSPPSPIARGPIRSAASRASSASRSRTATEAPRRCICRAVSNPMPRAAPVTSATLPLRS